MQYLISDFDTISGLTYDFYVFVNIFYLALCK